MKYFAILAVLAFAFFSVGCGSTKSSRDYFEEKSSTADGEKTVIHEETKTRSFGLPIGVRVYSHGDGCACTRCYEYRANHSGLFTRPPYDNGCGGGGYSRKYVQANGPYTPDGRPLGGRRDPDGVIRYYPTDFRR